jgi:hypothetical protein
MALLLCASQLGMLPAAAQATQTVSLQTSFDPDRLGVSTTIEFGFEVHSTAVGEAPSPVTDVDLSLPAGMGLASSTLGLAQCQPATLLALGAEGCPANAQIGYGTALGEVPINGETVLEPAEVQALFGPVAGENLQVLFYADAKAPVSAQLVFPGQLLTSPSHLYSGRLDTAIPLIPTWPDGPDIAITNFSSTIGPLGLTYYRHLHGKVVPFHPRGIKVPTRCPRGGFPFRVQLMFLDGTQTSTTSNVPCP